MIRNNGGRRAVGCHKGLKEKNCQPTKNLLSSKTHWKMMAKQRHSWITRSWENSLLADLPYKKYQEKFNKPKASDPRGDSNLHAGDKISAGKGNYVIV